MKTILLFSSLFLLFIAPRSFAQNGKADKDPEISFRVISAGITDKGNAYDVYLKSTQDLKSAKIVGLSVTLLFDKKRNSKILSVENNFTDKLSYFIFPEEFDKSNFHYSCFYIDYRDYIPFSITVNAREELKLFRFYTDGTCGEIVRLLRGVSQFSRFSQPNSTSDGLGGAVVDEVPEDQNMQNSIALGIDGRLIEGYRGKNHGSAIGCYDKSSARTESVNSIAKYNLVVNDYSINKTTTPFLPKENTEATCIAIPNPISQTNQLVVRTSNFAPVSFKLFNAGMQQWQVQAIATSPTTYQITLNYHLAAGVYYLQLTNAKNEACVIKIFKPQ